MAHPAMGLSEFVEVHAVLLAAAGVPPALHSRLFEKLQGETFDAGSFFTIEEVEVNGGHHQRRAVLSAEILGKECDIFLVDHAWSFRLTEARKQLTEVPGLAERMAALMGVADTADGNGEEGEEPGEDKCPEAVLAAAEEAVGGKAEDVLWLELDDCPVTDQQLQHLKLGLRYPNLVGLSLWGSKLESTAAALETLSQLQELRALWLNDTPVHAAHGAELEATVLEKLPHLELYNSRLTSRYSLWSLGFCAGVYGPDTPGVGGARGEQRHPLWTVHELDLTGRGVRHLKPELFSETEAPVLRVLDLSDNPLDQQERSDLLAALSALPSLRELCLTLPNPLGHTAEEIKHLLPPRVETVHTDPAKAKSEPNGSALAPRLPQWSPEEPLAERVLRAMWQHVMVYRLATEDKLDETPIWYVMDEFGSALRHSDVPNFACAPFMYLPDGTMKSAISYSLVWPIVDTASGEECFRDYLNGVTEDQLRSARLTAWFETPRAYFKQAYKEHKASLAAATAKPRESRAESAADPLDRKVPDRRPLKVFTDIPQSVEYLTRPDFVLVNSPAEADIVWAYDQVDESYRKIHGMREEQFINQFPFEACLVMKHNLNRTITSVYGQTPWLQPTYELDSQLPALIGDFYTREEAQENNLWILKPWNMARSIDTTVTRELPAIIRCMETGPKIAQKYIEKPATFRGRKFDLRFIVLLKSVSPLQLYLYDIFWVRLANNAYTTDEKSLADYDTHFTVMNYGPRKMTNILLPEFIAEFEEERNSSVRWADVDGRVRTMMREMFEAAAARHPEMHDPHARAMYGVDVMLDEALQPKLLEVTYCPDTNRACTVDWKRWPDGRVMEGKEFYNRVFGCLFLDEDDGFKTL